MKSHLLLSPEPLTFAGDFAIGLCGATVAHPVPEMMQEIGERGLPEFNSLRDCAKCVKLAEAAERKLGKTYVYAVIPGEEQYRGDCISSLLDTVKKVSE